MTGVGLAILAVLGAVWALTRQPETPAQTRARFTLELPSDAKVSPTVVGRSILQGRYVIEHDNDRMARGEPCTHVYAFADQQNPVATFHCTHLERDRADQNQVVLATMPDGRKKLTEFQFAGEHAAHGYPSGR